MTVGACGSGETPGLLLYGHFAVEVSYSVSCVWRLGYAVVTSVGVLADSPQPQSENSDTAISPPWRGPTHHFEMETLRGLHRATLIHIGALAALQICADRTDYSAIPTVVPHGAPHIGRSNTKWKQS